MHNRNMYDAIRINFAIKIKFGLSENFISIANLIVGKDRRHHHIKFHISNG